MVNKVNNAFVFFLNDGERSIVGWAVWRRPGPRRLNRKYRNNEGSGYQERMKESSSFIGPRRRAFSCSTTRPSTVNVRREFETDGFFFFLLKHTNLLSIIPMGSSDAKILL